MPWRIFHLFHGIYILYHGLSLLDEFVKVIGSLPEAKVLEPRKNTALFQVKQQCVFPVLPAALKPCSALS